MWRPGDIVVKVEQKVLLKSAAHRLFLQAAPGILFRATRRTNGFQVTVQTKRKLANVVQFFAEEKFETYRNGAIRSFLLCAKCKKLARYRLCLYLDWDSLTPQCRKCIGLSGRFIPEYEKQPIDYGDRSRFRKLVHRKFIIMATNREMKLLKELNPEEFFESRPYLIPPFFHFVRSLDEGLYKNCLWELRSRYRLGLQKYMRHEIRPKDLEWLERQFEERIKHRQFISDKENECLQKFLKQFSSNRPGIAPDPFGSLRTVTACSFSKTPSSQDMNAPLAKARAARAAKIAAAKAATSGSPGSSSAPPVLEPALSLAPSATAKEDSSLSPTSPSVDPQPEESSALATR